MTDYHKGILIGLQFSIQEQLDNQCSDTDRAFLERLQEALKQNIEPPTNDQPKCQPHAPVLNVTTGQVCCAKCDHQIYLNPWKKEWEHDNG